VAVGQQHDENQIYGCLMVPVDLQRALAPEDGPKAQVERKSWREWWRSSWRLVHVAALRHAKRPMA
jgi:hypothetical protein